MQREGRHSASHLELEGHCCIEWQDEQIRAGILRQGRHSFSQLLHSLLSTLCTVSHTPAMHVRAQAVCCRSIQSAYKAACSMQLVQYLSAWCSCQPGSLQVAEVNADLGLQQ